MPQRDDAASALLQQDIDEICRCRFIEQHDGPARAFFISPVHHHVYGLLRVGVDIATGEGERAGLPLPSTEDAIRGFVQAFVPQVEAVSGTKDIPKFVIWRIRPEIIAANDGFYAYARYVFSSHRQAAQAAIEQKKAEDAAKSTVGA